MKYPKMEVRLKRDEESFLKEFSRRGVASARAITRANVLLLLHAGQGPAAVGKTLNVTRATVYNIKNRYKVVGAEDALKDKPRPGQPRKYTDKHEAEIIALACTSPPKGRKRWTVRLLAEHMRKKRGCKTISRETVRLVLKKRGRSPG